MLTTPITAVTGESTPAVLKHRARPDFFLKNSSSFSSICHFRLIISTNLNFPNSECFDDLDRKSGTGGLLSNYNLNQIAFKFDFRFVLWISLWFRISLEDLILISNLPDSSKLLSHDFVRWLHNRMNLESWKFKALNRLLIAAIDCCHLFTREALRLA